MFQHGRSFAFRSCYYANIFLWKTNLLVFFPVYLMFVSAYSAQNTFSVTYSIIFPFVLGFFDIVQYLARDQDIPVAYYDRKYVEILLPFIYAEQKKKDRGDIPSYLGWFFYAAATSALVFAICYFGMNSVHNTNGIEYDFWQINFLTYWAIWNGHTFQQIIYLRNWNSVCKVQVVLNYLLFFPLIVSLDGETTTNSPYYKLAFTYMGQPNFWFVMILTSSIFVLPALVWVRCKELFFPSMAECCRTICNRSDLMDKDPELKRDQREQAPSEFRGTFVMGSLNRPASEENSLI